MFFNFFFKKIWLLVKMFFSYTAYENLNVFIFSLQKYFFSTLLLFLCLIFF